MAKTAGTRSKQAKAAASQEPTAASQDLIDESKEGATAAKARAQAVPWDANKEWTWTGIKYLQQHPVFRLKLFGDSVGEAKREGWKKVANGDGKAQLFHELAKVIFTADGIDDKTREGYQGDPKWYSKSTQQQFSRLKKKYGEHRARFKDTGEGVKLGSEAANLEAEILQEWPFYADLHALWSELPNYNPVGVSNATPGQDHAGQAASLFDKPRKSKKSSQEAEDDVVEVLEDDEDDRAVDPATSEWTSEDDDLGITLTNDNNDDEIAAVPMTTISTAASKPEPDNVKVKPNLKAVARHAKSTKGKSGKGKKRPYANSLDFDDIEDLHAMELKEEARRREERARLRMKELELEQEKMKAKTREAGNGTREACC
ncbi:hypothetical protein EST38_g13088 [Candolleomyces aberdarensis]|uniref:Uncharacterized protein n=1 Tax=Candolleomyces aberdarensis TaxID=2316362 RepID=A0A4Q2D2X1_9AGAR|nr:hypothetical protein EST38_g13088 [Candolleomyces aberdarensis]